MACEFVAAMDQEHTCAEPTFSRDGVNVAMCVPSFMVLVAT